MLGDIIKALELLMGSIRTLRSPEMKRQRVARQLLKVYLDIDNVLERGEEIINILETYPESQQSYDRKQYTVFESVLATQQRALSTIIDDLDHPSIKGILAIHFPKRKHFYAFVREKENMLFYFSEILSRAYEFDMIQTKIQIEPGQHIKVPQYLALHDEGYQLFPPLYDNDTPVDVRFTLEELQMLRIQLKQIGTLQEELRLFLIDKFNFEDVM
ncbi:MAG: hypothetical protein BroJett011_76400 [Chloroflexota bacterium]|nr:MAG: hypothetical protein BroJett011_76400 [Chloroflexota bacterium]